MEIKTQKDFSSRDKFLDYLKAEKGDIKKYKLSTPRIGHKQISMPYTEKAFSPVSTAPVNVDGVDELDIIVVANTSNYIDSYLDMLGDNGAKSSIKSRMGIIPQLHDHDHTLSAEIGDMLKIWYKDVPLRDLGFNADGSANALLAQFICKRELNESIFMKYAGGRVRQHSVGLTYEDIILCVNSDEKWWSDEKEAYDTYYDLAINKEKADRNGHFWYVPEWNLLENSSVLFGANELTPTLSVKIIKKDSAKLSEKRYLSQLKAFNSLKTQ